MRISEYCLRLVSQVVQSWNSLECDLEHLLDKLRAIDIGEKLDSS